VINIYLVHDLSKLKDHHWKEW